MMSASVVMGPSSGPVATMAHAQPVESPGPRPSSDVVPGADDPQTLLFGLAEHGLLDLIDEVAARPEWTTDLPRPERAVRAALADVARAKARLVLQAEAMADATTGVEALQPAVDAVLAAWRRLLDVTDLSDARRPVWMGDFAADLLALGIELGGVDLVVEFGIPAGDEVRRQTALAAELLDLTDRALLDVGDAIMELEDHPDFRDDLELQRQRRQLVNEEQRRRLPYLHALGRYHWAIGNFGDPDMLAREMATVADEFRIVEPALDPAWRDRAVIMRYLAHVRSGRTPNAAADDDVSSPPTTMTPVNQLSDGLQARLALLEVLRANARRPEDARGTASSALPASVVAAQTRAIQDAAGSAWASGNGFLLLLLGDAALRVGLAGEGWPLGLEHGAMRGGGASGPGVGAAEALFSRAENTYSAVFARGGLEVSSAELEWVLSQRIARLLPSDAPDASLPVPLRLARLQRELSGLDPRDEDELVDIQTRLEALLSSAESNDPLRARILMTLAKAHFAGDDPLTAALRWLEVAEQFRNLSMAEEAAANAAAAAELAWRREGANSGMDKERAADAFRRAMTLAVREFPTLPDVDRWAYALGRFELDQGRPEASVSALTQVVLSSPWYVDARFEMALAERARAMAAPVEAADAVWKSAADAAVRAREVAARALASAAPAPEVESPGPGERSEESSRRARLAHYVAAAELIIAESEFARREFASAAARLEQLASDTAAPPSVVVEALLQLIELRERTGNAAAIVDDLEQLGKRSPAVGLSAMVQVLARIEDDALALIARGEFAPANRLRVDRAGPIADIAVGLVSTVPASTPDRERLGQEARRHQATVDLLRGEVARSVRTFSELRQARPADASIAMGLAEARFAAGEDAAAMALYREIVTSPAARDPMLYWQSELRMLQILDRTQRNTERIFPRIQRLRAIDPQLGGPAFRESFVGLELRYSR